MPFRAQRRDTRHQTFRSKEPWVQGKGRKITRRNFSSRLTEVIVQCNFFCYLDTTILRFWLASRPVDFSLNSHFVTSKHDNNRVKRKKKTGKQILKTTTNDVGSFPSLPNIYLLVPFFSLMKTPRQKKKKKKKDSIQVTGPLGLTTK